MRDETDKEMKAEEGEEGDTNIIITGNSSTSKEKGGNE